MKRKFAFLATAVTLLALAGAVWWGMKRNHLKANREFLASVTSVVFKYDNITIKVDDPKELNDIQAALRDMQIGGRRLKVEPRARFVLNSGWKSANLLSVRVGDVSVYWLDGVRYVSPELDAILSDLIKRAETQLKSRHSESGR